MLNVYLITRHILYFNKTIKLQNTIKIKMFDILNIYFVSNKGFGKTIYVQNGYTLHKCCTCISSYKYLDTRILQKL